MGQRAPHPQVEQRIGRGKLRPELEYRGAIGVRLQDDVARAARQPILLEWRQLLRFQGGVGHEADVVREQTGEGGVRVGNEGDADAVDLRRSEHKAGERSALDERARLPGRQAVRAQADEGRGPERMAGERIRTLSVVGRLQDVGGQG